MDQIYRQVGPKMTSMNRYFLFGGCVGLLVAISLTGISLVHFVPPPILLVLWPSSIAGMAITEPGKLTGARFVILAIMYGGNFMVYAMLACVVKLIRRT
jgi:hypothetical protein